MYAIMNRLMHRYVQQGRCSKACYRVQPQYAVIKEITKTQSLREGEARDASVKMEKGKAPEKDEIFADFIKAADKYLLKTLFFFFY